MNEINLALHQHNTSRNHSTTATQGAAARSSDNGAETSSAREWRRARVAVGAGDGGRGRRRGRVAAGEGGGGRGRRARVTVGAGDGGRR